MKWRVDVATRIGDFELSAALDGEASPTVLVGPNGAGKTTLLRLIAGVQRPAHGRIQVGERALLDTRQQVDLPPERRGVGYVPQGYGLFPHLRVIDNVAFGLAYIGTRPHAARRRLAMQWLERLECAALAPRMPAELSGGERQRVALARALSVEPEILLLDEPLAALDAGARRGMRGFLAAHLVARGKPSVVVTHDLRDVLALDGSVCVLEGGRVVQRGTASELARGPTTAFVEELFGAATGLPGKT